MTQQKMCSLSDDQFWTQLVKTQLTEGRVNNMDNKILLLWIHTCFCQSCSQILGKCDVAMSCIWHVTPSTTPSTLGCDWRWFLRRRLMHNWNQMTTGQLTNWHGLQFEGTRDCFVEKENGLRINYEEKIEKICMHEFIFGPLWVSWASVGINGVFALCWIYGHDRALTYVLPYVMTLIACHIEHV